MIILGVSSSPSAANHTELKVRKISGQKIVIALLFKLLLPKVRATLASNSQQKKSVVEVKGKEIRQTLCCMILLGFFRPGRSQRSMHFNHFELTDQWLLTITLFSCNMRIQKQKIV